MGGARRRIMKFKNIPRQIILDIFSRLPISLLFRMRCVCKEWYNLTRDPWLHRMRMARPIEEEEALFLISLRDIENDRTDLRLMTQHCTPPKHLFRFPMRCKVLHSFHGLVCSIRSVSHPESDIEGTMVSVSNPLTGEHLTLPLYPAASFSDCTVSLCNFGLGIDSSINKYKIVGVKFLELNFANGHYRLGAEVCTIGTTSSNSWRKIRSKPTVPTTRHEVSVFASGARHWMVDYRCNPNDKETMVISFDFEKEEFKTLPRKEAFSGDMYSWYQLVDLKGCLGMGDFSFTRFTIWKLMDYERNHWVREYRIGNIIPRKVVGLMGEDEIVLWTDIELLAYNSKTTTLRNIYTFASHAESETIFHRGSLVSLLS